MDAVSAAYQKTKRAIHLVATQEPHIYEVNVSSARTPISVNQSIILLLFLQKQNFRTKF
jgi:hypothetical protein